MDIQLSERQRTAVATAITILAAVVILAAIGALIWLLAAFVSRFRAVFLPIAVGAIAALVFHPYYEWLRDKLRLPKVAALVAVFLSVLIPVGAFLWFFGALIFEQLVGLASKAPEWWKGAEAFVRERWPQVLEFLEQDPLGQRLKSAVEGQQEALMEGLQRFGDAAWGAGTAVVRGVGSLLSWAVLPVYFAFFLMVDPRRFMDLDDELPFLKPETRKDVIYLMRQFIEILVAFFRGQLIVAFLQGVLYAIGFSAVGLKYGFVLGLMLGFLNIIPYLGSIVGLSTAIPLAYFQEGGGLEKVILVLVVFTIVQLIESYVLTPKIMGDRTGLHFMTIIVAIFFWGSALGGIMGMVLAIPLTAFFVVFWRLAKEKYIKELV